MRKIMYSALVTSLVFIFASCTKEQVLNNTPYQAVLLPSNEVPARASDGYGDAIGIFNNDTKVLSLRINYYNLKAALTAWHIHKAPPGVNGSVVFNFGPPQPSAFLYVSPPLTADQENDLKTGNYYVNLHTSVYPGGEIRGQLQKR